MTTWLYQLSPKVWSPDRYRLEIWEGERWNWPVGEKHPASEIPEPGDIIVFFYSPTGGIDPGYYGWAIVLEWFEGSSSPLYFRPVAPSDYLKMRPWWNEDANNLANKIRGAVKQGTMWKLPDRLVPEIRGGICRWLYSGSGS
jgi:signal peptidase I